eukprot:evm.model.NODE_32970_length_10329_cov_25.798626.3
MADKNLGLARQVLDEVAVKTLRRLTRTYVTLSLEDIAQHAGCATAAAAEKLVVDQVAQGKIVAAVDEVTGMVFFSENEPEEAFGYVGRGGREGGREGERG